LTARNGLRRRNASALPDVSPTSRDPARPGPAVAATPSRRRRGTFAFLSAASTTSVINRMWLRDASSGTTPPYGRWTAICEATMLDSSRGLLRPGTVATTAAAVSSHEDSIPRMITSDIVWQRRPGIPRPLDADGGAPRGGPHHAVGTHRVG